MACRPLFDWFETKSEDIKRYMEQLQEYSTACDIEDNKGIAAEHQAILSPPTGNNPFQVLKDLAFSRSSNMKTFDQLSTQQCKHLKPYHLKVTERYCFHLAVQRQGHHL